MDVKVNVKGSFTVENAVIMPMFLLIIFMIIGVTGLYHDKLVIKNAVLQAAVEVNDSKYKTNAADDELSKRIKSYAQLKSMFARNIKAEVINNNGKYIIKCTADYGMAVELFGHKRNSVIDVEKEVSLTSPVKVIRITNEVMEVISEDE
ncbi:MAG: TadE family protein [Lachnospira sp.]